METVAAKLQTADLSIKPNYCSFIIFVWAYVGSIQWDLTCFIIISKIARLKPQYVDCSRYLESHQFSRYICSSFTVCNLSTLHVWLITFSKQGRARFHGIWFPASFKHMVSFLSAGHLAQPPSLFNHREGRVLASRINCRIETLVFYRACIWTET